MKLLKYAMLPFIALSCFACSDDDESAIKNDMIKKTVSPAIAGEKIEFAYAMGTTNGRINKAEAVASITGATGTGCTPGSQHRPEWMLTVYIMVPVKMCLSKPLKTHLPTVAFLQPT